jgi:mono/diheme cytochrome c family protein
MEEGKRLYGIYCTHCHGASGMGDGLVAQKLPGPPPAYSSPQLKNLSEGKMFHSITYGKNLMGPHGSQLNAGERWKIIAYIKTLQNPAGSAPADTTAKK